MASSNVQKRLKNSHALMFSILAEQDTRIQHLCFAGRRHGGKSNDPLYSLLLVSWLVAAADGRPAAAAAGGATAPGGWWWWW